MADILFDMLAAAMTCAVWSYLYKDNPGYLVVEAASLGIVSANAMILGIDAIQATVIGNILKGSWWYILAIILGISFFFILAPPGPLRTIYRASAMIMMTMELGRAFPTNVVNTYQVIQGATATFDIGKVVWMICIVCGLSFYIWNRSTDRFLAPVRVAGKYIWYVYAGYNTAGSYLTRAAGLALLTATAISFPAILVTIAALAIIAIDAMFGWDQILGRAPKEAAVSQK